MRESAGFEDDETAEDKRISHNLELFDRYYAERREDLVRVKGFPRDIADDAVQDCWFTLRKVLVNPGYVLDLDNGTLTTPNGEYRWEAYVRSSIRRRCVTIVNPRHHNWGPRVPLSSEGPEEQVDVADPTVDVEDRATHLAMIDRMLTDADARLVGARPGSKLWMTVTARSKDPEYYRKVIVETVFALVDQSRKANKDDPNTWRLLVPLILVARAGWLGSRNAIDDLRQVVYKMLCAGYAEHFGSDPRPADKTALKKRLDRGWGDVRALLRAVMPDIDDEDEDERN
jgi:hypothetical protein